MHQVLVTDVCLPVGWLRECNRQSRRQAGERRRGNELLAAQQTGGGKTAVYLRLCVQHTHLVGVPVHSHNALKAQRPGLAEPAVQTA